MNDNLAIWTRNETTPVEHTKTFDRGGFKGRSTNATFTAKRLTTEFGPCGKGWGVEVLADDLLQGAPIKGFDAHEVIHRVRIRFWWKDEEGEHSFNQFGQTAFVTAFGKDPPNGRGRYLFTDEEAPKKSLTDAMTKAASWLGFSADIHMGMYDDNKYLAERRQEQVAETRKIEADHEQRLAATRAPPQPAPPAPKKMTKGEWIANIEAEFHLAGAAGKDAVDALANRRDVKTALEKFEGIMKARVEDAISVAYEAAGKKEAEADDGWPGPKDVRDLTAPFPAFTPNPDGPTARAGNFADNDGWTR